MLRLSSHLLTENLLPPLFLKERFFLGSNRCLQQSASSVNLSRGHMVRNPVAVQSPHQSTSKNSAIMSMRTIERNNWSCTMWGTDIPLISHGSQVRWAHQISWPAVILVTLMGRIWSGNSASSDWESYWPLIPSLPSGVDFESLSAIKCI